MAAPNIINVTSAIGSTDVLDVTTTPQIITQNGAASGQVYKINSFSVANIDGTNSAEISVEIFRGGSSYYLVRSVTVPANASLVIMSRENAIYLVEGDQLRVSASANGDLQAIVSYDIIDDA